MVINSFDPIDTFPIALGKSSVSEIAKLSNPYPFPQIGSDRKNLSIIILGEQKIVRRYFDTSKEFDYFAFI